MSSGVVCVADVDTAIDVCVSCSAVFATQSVGLAVVTVTVGDVLIFTTVVDEVGGFVLGTASVFLFFCAAKVVDFASVVVDGAAGMRSLLGGVAGRCGPTAVSAENAALSNSRIRSGFQPPKQGI